MTRRLTPSSGGRNASSRHRAARVDGMEVDVTIQPDGEILISTQVATRRTRVTSSSLIEGRVDTGRRSEPTARALSV